MEHGTSLLPKIPPITPMTRLSLPAALAILLGATLSPGLAAAPVPPPPAAPPKEWTDDTTTAAILKSLATLDAGLARTFFVDDGRTNRGGEADREGIQQIPKMGLNDAERSVIELDAHLKSAPPGPHADRLRAVRGMLADFVLSARQNVFNLNLANFNMMKADREMDSARLWQRPGGVARNAASLVNAKNKFDRAQALSADAQRDRQRALDEIKAGIQTLDRRLDSLPMPVNRDVALALAKSMHRVKDAMLPNDDLPLTWDAVWVRRELISAAERRGALALADEATAYLVKPAASGTRAAVGAVVKDLETRATTVPPDEKASLTRLAATLTDLFAAETAWKSAQDIAAANRADAAKKEADAPARLVPNRFGTVDENGYLKLLRDAKHLRFVATSLERQANGRMIGAINALDGFLSALPEEAGGSLSLSLAQAMHQVRTRTIPNEKLDLIWTARRLELALMPPDQRENERLKALGWLVLHLGTHGVLQTWDPAAAAGFMVKKAVIHANQMAMGDALETVWPGIGRKGRQIVQQMILSMVEKKESWRDLIVHPSVAGLKTYAMQEFPALNRVCNAADCIQGLVDLFKLCDPQARN